MIPNSRFAPRKRYRPHWSAPLQLEQRLPLALRFWMRQQPTKRSAWAACQRADWMLAWLAVDAELAALEQVERVRADVGAARATGVPEAELADLVRALWPKRLAGRRHG